MSRTDLIKTNRALQKMLRDAQQQLSVAVINIEMLRTEVQNLQTRVQVLEQEKLTTYMPFYGPQTFTPAPVKFEPYCTISENETLADNFVYKPDTY